MTRKVRIIGLACAFGSVADGRVSGPDARRKLRVVSRLRRRGLRISRAETIYSQADSKDPLQRGWEMHARLGRDTAEAHLGGEAFVVIGARDDSQDQLFWLEALGIRAFSQAALARYGLEKVMHRALEIALHHIRGFGVSIDLSAIEAAVAMGSGDNGLWGSELVHPLRLIHAEPNFLGFEIAGYDPSVDDDHRIARLMEDLNAAVFTGQCHARGHRAGKPLLGA